ncbi:hypothetical protein [Streptomyces laculatispora]|uniref:hypothetical protein n=1 Tax=Streptomyces laculatispora TaxID=887464 RepID=UPI001A94E854|nr:hypothetical protein [Streptomyces laculatispora]MBO0917516.1 hypothetical protein [Streptomyces laculatispora]
MTQCQLCEQQMDDDGYLCRGCVKATRVRLECLPDLYAGLLPFLAPPGGNGGGRGSKPVYAPLPVVEDILDLRGPGGLVGTAEQWLTVICRDRGHTVATPDGGGIEARLRAAVSGLLANMPWVAVSWPDAGEFAADIRELSRSVTSIIAPVPAVDRGRRIGHCPAIDPSGTLCGAVLRLAPGEKAVRCGWCDTRYPPYVWAQLKAWMTEDEKARHAA